MDKKSKESSNIIVKLIENLLEGVFAGWFSVIGTLSIFAVLFNGLGMIFSFLFSAPPDEFINSMVSEIIYVVKNFSGIGIIWGVILGVWYFIRDFFKNL